MEMNQERVIAYQLAKEVTFEDIKNVSGGANSSSITHRECMIPTGSNPTSMDITIDASIDW